MKIALILILVHLLGDFFLQCDSCVRSKEKKKLKSGYLYVHVLLHGIMAFLLLLGFQVEMLKALSIALVTISTHFAIDAIKLYAQKNNPLSKRNWFFGDQALHFLVIALIWFVMENPTPELYKIINIQVLALLIPILFLLNPTSIVIEKILSLWERYLPKQNKELPNAGKYIGILERLFTFVFIVTNNWEGIGFLLAAKSVFRFGDLNKTDDRNLTEYILIGTLLSFGVAILCGILYTSLV